MSDHRLRELERRFRLSGNLADEAAWLRARVQAGELTQSGLELAAFLGHAAASAALGVQGSDAPQTVEGWLTFEGRGEEPLTRAVLASASLLLGRLDSTPPLFETLSEVVRAIEAWCLDPMAERAEEISAGYSQTKRLVDEHLGGYEEPGYALLQVFALVSESSGSPNWQGCVQWALRCAEKATSASEVHAAVRKELVPWALGYSDPVRERLEGHQRRAARG